MDGTTVTYIPEHRDGTIRIVRHNGRADEYFHRIIAPKKDRGIKIIIRPEAKSTFVRLEINVFHPVFMSKPQLRNLFRSESGGDKTIKSLELRVTKKDGVVHLGSTKVKPADAFQTSKANVAYHLYEIFAPIIKLHSKDIINGVSFLLRHVDKTDRTAIINSVTQALDSMEDAFQQRNNTLGYEIWSGKDTHIREQAWQRAENRLLAGQEIGIRIGSCIERTLQKAEIAGRVGSLVFKD